MLVLPIPVTKVPEQERLNEILNKNLAMIRWCLVDVLQKNSGNFWTGEESVTLILWRMKWWHRKMRWQRQRCDRRTYQPQSL